MTDSPATAIRRYSSRLSRLDRSLLVERLRGATAYDRIAGYFSSSLLEVAGEEIEAVTGGVRIVCNSHLEAADILTARAAANAQWQEYAATSPEVLVEGAGGSVVRGRYARLHRLLRAGKLVVRVLPDESFGLMHGKAGVITQADGSKSAFLGSANESKSAWQVNYELIWEDNSPEAVAWVQTEFDALWNHPQARPLADAIIQEMERLAGRSVIATVDEWQQERGDKTPDPAAPIIETPVYRSEVGLWQHQKYFVKLVFDEHMSTRGKARFVLADQVGLGKTLQLAMSAQLIALSSDEPILIICPKGLMQQWQNEMRDLLDLPSAQWNGRQWVDENGTLYAAGGPELIRKCPRRIGLVSSGLIKRRSEVSEVLLQQRYACVILDEAHHARRRNLGERRDGESADPNNLLRFMGEIAERSRSVLLATATPVQMRPIEAWDLLSILARGDDSVLGDKNGRWRNAKAGLDLVMERATRPLNDTTKWEWFCNPLPPASEDRLFDRVRREFQLPAEKVSVPGNFYQGMRPPTREMLARQFPELVRDHNPYIRRIVRRTRQQLEALRDPVTREPLLRRIGVVLHGESDSEAIILPAYLRDAYSHAEIFCKMLGARIQAAGFLKTMLLRRIGSSMAAGQLTATRMLEGWAEIEDDDDDELESDETGVASGNLAEITRALTAEERAELQRLLFALESNKERDPKVKEVIRYLRDGGWLEQGCIIFSQYRDSIDWLAAEVADEFPDETIGIYSGSQNSGTQRGSEFTPRSREALKEMVRKGELRLLLGTDAASEGLNLQRLSCLINLDLPWNPTRLEQRKGRIQRIGQVHDEVHVLNMRYRDSVEDRVHELLSGRLESIYTLFGQVPDMLQSAWTEEALGNREAAKRVIDSVPEQHPFDLRYTNVEPVDWESCSRVLDARARSEKLKKGWQV